MRKGSVMSEGQEVRWNDDVSRRKFLVHHPQFLRLSPEISGHQFKFMVTIMMSSSSKIHLKHGGVQRASLS